MNNLLLNLLNHQVLRARVHRLLHIKKDVDILPTKPLLLVLDLTEQLLVLGGRRVIEK